MNCLSDKDSFGKEWRHKKMFGTENTKAQYLGLAPMFCHPRGTPNIHFYVNTDHFKKFDWCSNYTVGDMVDEERIKFTYDYIDPP